MKAIIIVLIFLCGVAAASQPFIIAPLVWDESGNLEADVQITYTFGDQTFTQSTASDGSCCFDCRDFKGISEGDQINVSCKYGYKIATINHNFFGQGVTFNEPSEDAAISVFEAMGYVAIPTTIAGIYWLIRRRRKP